MKKKSEIKLREYKQPQTLHDLLDNCRHYSRYEIENQWWYEIGGYAITGADVAKYKKINQLLSEWKIIEPINSMYSAFYYKED